MLSAKVWTAVFLLPQSATNLLSLRTNIQRDSGVHHVTGARQPHSYHQEAGGAYLAPPTYSGPLVCEVLSAKCTLSPSATFSY
jgi:hypothetical protein